MDNEKKAAFVRAYKRQNFSKGGLIRKLGDRKYFADGGTTLSGPGSTTNNSANNPNTGLLGTVGAALGINNNFQAQGANLQAGTSAGQLNNTYNGVNQALIQQQGLANQFSQGARQATDEQNMLAQAYTGIMNGTGPNPAQAELNQNTAANVNQQAALMAGQRGANANAGLIARQAAMQGAGVQQQAVGQAATLQAQQQIAAQQNLQNLATQQAGQQVQSVGALNQAQQNEQGILQGANSNFNNANVGMQSNINNANAQTAAGNQGMLGKVLGGVAGGASSLLSSIGLAHGGEVESPDHVKLAEMNAASMHHIKKMAWGGPLQGNPLVGNQTVNSQGMGSSGGYAPQGSVSGPEVGSLSIAPDSDKTLEEGITKGFSSLMGEPEGESVNGEAQPWEMGGGLAGEPQMSADTMYAAQGGSVCEGPLSGHVANYFAQGGKVPAMVSPGEIYLSPDQVQKVVSEGVDPAKIGHKFNGKAKVKGDSLKNDTIPADLEEGGVVIDRKNMGSKEKRELFVHKAIARKKAGG